MAVKAFEMTDASLSMPQGGRAFSLSGAALPGWLHGIGRSLPQRAPERLLILAPALMLPTAGTAADFLLLALLFICLVAGDALLAAPAGARSQPRLAALAGLLLLLTLALAPGVALPMALLALVALLERRAPDGIRLLLGGLTGALLIDFSLIAQGFERSDYWLALGGAVGLAFATTRAIGRTAATADSTELLAEPDGRRSFLEVVLMTALVLVVAFYGALLAGEPQLAGAVAAGGQLTVPLVAAAAWRIADRVLAGDKGYGFDRLTASLAGLWALAALALL